MTGIGVGGSCHCCGCKRLMTTMQQESHTPRWVGELPSGDHFVSIALFEDHFVNKLSSGDQFVNELPSGNQFVKELPSGSSL